MKAKRFVEIDAARGALVLLMLAYNWSFALAFFNLLPFDLKPWYWLSGFVSAWFFLAGLSAWLALQRKPETDVFKHGVLVFLAGAGITAVTLVGFPGYAVWFGVLHLIGVSVMLAPFFVRWKKWNAVIGLAVIAAGFLVKNSLFDSNAFLFLGMRAAPLQTFDYTPLFPWFGFFLIGMAYASVFYAKTKTKQETFIGENNALCVLGRHSLLVYLVHQPLFVGLLWLFGLIKLF